VGVILGSFAILVVGAMYGSTPLFWLGVAGAVLRPVAAVVQGVRAETTALSWPAFLGLGLTSFAFMLFRPEFIRDNLVEAFKIPSESMIPGLANGDHIFVNKRREPAAGDIIVYKTGSEGRSYAKRLIAVGPAKIRVVGRQVYLNEKPLALATVDVECPLQSPCKVMSETLGGASHAIVFQDFSADSDEAYETFVNHDEVYVLGDNRDGSHDSSHHGPVSIRDISGVMTMIYWSASK